MADLFPIRIDQCEFAAGDQSIDNSAWIEALANAHMRDVTFCCCNPSTPVKLVVKRYGASSPTAKYGLARWPDTGLDHQLECHFFSQDETPSEKQSAFDDLGEGKVRVHLEETLTRTVEKGRAAEFARALKPAPNREPGEAAVRRERASQSTLLKSLWRQARLNIYGGKPRTWFQATFAIINAAKKIVINRQSETLADYLYVLSAPSDKLAKSHNEAVLAHVNAAQSRMYVIGRLRSYKTDKAQTLLPFLDFQTLPKTLVTVSQLEAAYGSGTFIRNFLHSSAGTLIGFATIEPAGGEWWKTVSLTTLTASKNMLPATSFAELDFEAYLSEQGRTFIKPIHVSEEARAAALPEFVLLDTAQRVRCEIWGSQTECLLEEKSLKVQEAQAKARHVIAWSANPREPLPDLPS